MLLTAGCPGQSDANCTLSHMGSQTTLFYCVHGQNRTLTTRIKLKTISNPALLLPSMNNLALSDSFHVQQNAAKKKVKAKLDAIMEDLVKLSKKASKVEDWSAATDLVVERAMKENENLKKEYDRINAVKREVTELMAEFDLDEIRDGLSIQECDLKLDEVEKEVEATVKTVEEQNDTRELYSLDDVKVDKVKLPTFSGKESEDYEKFKSDLLKGFAQNRVTQADKLGKLRECLYGEAKKLVPHSIHSNVDDALKVLDQAYGDPIRLFTYRQDYFFKLGKQPKKTDKGGYKAQVEWFRDVEVVMESLLALALKDKICAATLFSPKEMKSYLNAFDVHEFEQLTQCEGLGELQFRNWLFKIGQFREKAQKFAKYKETGSSCLQVTTFHGNNKKANQNNKHEQPSFVMFKPPKRHVNCRICSHLSKNRDARMLFDNHNSNFPSGCPIFISMSIAERVKVCKDAKICFRCHDPSYVWKFTDIKSKSHKCASKTSRSRYICQNSGCNIHIWCCATHLVENDNSLKKFQQEIRTKFNLEFCFSAMQTWNQLHSIPQSLDVA